MPKMNKINPMRSNGQLQMMPNPKVATVKRNPTAIKRIPKIKAEIFISYL
jgi:hypothetical protein